MFVFSFKFIVKETFDWFAGNGFLSVWASAIIFKYTSLLKMKPEGYVSITRFVELSTSHCCCSAFQEPALVRNSQAAPCPSL